MRKKNYAYNILKQNLLYYKLLIKKLIREPFLFKLLVAHILYNFAKLLSYLSRLKLPVNKKKNSEYYIEEILINGLTRYNFYSYCISKHKQHII